MPLSVEETGSAAVILQITGARDVTPGTATARDRDTGYRMKQVTACDIHILRVQSDSQ